MQKQLRRSFCPLKTLTIRGSVLSPGAGGPSGFPSSAALETPSHETPSAAPLKPLDRSRPRFGIAPIVALRSAKGFPFAERKATMACHPRNASSEPCPDCDLIELPFYPTKDTRMSDIPGANITLAGDWSKPVNTLIEKISNALGGHFEPHYIRKVAQAQADAAKIEAAAGIEVTDLRQRALRRHLAEEAKRQQNMEAIFAKAVPGIAGDAKTQDVEDDWLTNFFDKCRTVSDEDMQTLWSKLLAGEANHPGSFSKRTVNFLAALFNPVAERIEP